MAMWVVVLVAFLGSVTGTIPRCSTECPIASAKFSYLPNKTYSYDYSGTSKIRLKGVEGGLAETHWKKEVLLSWLTHCDVAITFKGIKVDGETGPSGTNLLERYPLVVAVTDGRVQQVCSHPDDDTWSINMKKGVASALQNSLPSLSITTSGLTFTETDVVGTCPTKYKVRDEGVRVMVVKEKNHRLCQERFPTPDKIHLPWLKGPLPIQESHSTCTQEIVNGTISSVVCEDKNVVRPAYGVYKFVEATQTSELRLVSAVNSLPDSISHISHSQQTPKSLLYDYDPPKKEPSLVPELEQTLRHICQLTKDGVESESAKWVDKAVRLMRRVPEQSISQMYDKVRRRQLCADHGKLKSLFLDAISFVHESGSVPVIVNELMEGQVNEGRGVLYSAALYLISRPTARNMEAIKPLFELPQLIPSVTLSAASMINTFCRHNAQCVTQPSIRDISEALNTKLQSQCSPFSDEETQDAALLTLKALGNIGLMNHDMSTTILRCMRAQGPPVVVRVAAAETLRLMTCEDRITEDLVDIVLDPEMNSEVRIASYVVAVHCAHDTHLKRIVKVMSVEEDTQVRGFILSHMLNIQTTNTPHKERLRRLLTNIVLPVDFETDLRRYSRSFDVSYFSPSLGLGAEVESNLIYAPGSFIPRSLGMNITAALEEVSMNVAEFGVRLEGLDPILARLFGPGGYFQKSNYSKIIGDFFMMLQRKENENKVEGRQRRSTDNVILTNVLNEIYHNSIFNIRGNVAIRIMGQDVFFSSTSVDLSNLSLNEIKAEIYSAIYGLVQTSKTLRIDTARMLRPDLDYSFPTIQGTPLKLTAQVSVVAGLQLQTHLSDISVGSGFKVMPSLSVEAGGFIGYDAYISKTGLKINAAISSSNGATMRISRQQRKELRFHLDLPFKMNIFNAQVETFLMKSKRGQPDTKILPPSMHDSRIHRKSCAISLESVFGLKLCYDINVPDVLHNNALPLGAPAYARFSLNRTEPSMKGYLVNASLASHIDRKTLTMFCKTYGSETTKVFKIQTSLSNEPTNCTFSIVFDSSRIHSRAVVAATNSGNEKSVELFGVTRYDNMSLQRAVKFSVITTKTSLSQEYDFEIFYGYNQSLLHQRQIFEINIIKKENGPQLTVDIHGGTRNALLHYLKVEFGLGVDLHQRANSWLPSSARLRMFEFEGGFVEWKVISFIRISGESARETKHSSAFIVTHGSRQLARLQGDLRLHGTPPVNFMAQLLLQAGLQEMKYKGESFLYIQSNQVGASLQLLSSVTSATLIRLETFYTETQIKYSIRALIEVPRLINTLKAAASIGTRPDDEHTFLVEAAVTHGSSLLLHVEGPMTLSFKHEALEANVQWKISMIGEDPYSVNSIVIIANNSQFMYLILRTPQGQPVFLLEINPSSHSLEENDFQANVLVSHYIDVQTHLIFNTRQVQVTLNSLVFPGEHDSRRVKISSQMDLATTMLSADVWWDADRDANKKFRLEVTFATLSHFSDYSSLQGSIKYQEVICKFLAVTETVQLRHSLIKKTSFSIGVQTRERKDMNIEFENSIETRNCSTYIEVKMKYFGIENKKYKFICSVDLEDLNGLQNFKTESNIGYSSPTGHETSFTTEVTHQSSPSERVAQFKGTTRVSTLNRPLEMDLTWIGRDHSMSLVWKANQSVAWTLMEWQLTKAASGPIQSCSFIFNLRAVEEFLNDAVKFLTLESTCFTTECEEHAWNGVIHSLNIIQPNATLSTNIQSASLPMDTEASFFPPDVDVRMQEYSVAGRYTHDLWTDTFRYEGKVSHPALARDATAVIEYIISGSSQRGSFELDIFPDTADKITGSLASILSANNTVRVETNLTTRLLSYHPRVILNTAASPHTIAFDLKFSKNSSQVANFIAKTKLDEISEDAAVLSFMTATEGGVTVDVSGVVESRQVPECEGLQITTSSTIALLGNYSCVLSLCGPAFLELTIARKDKRGKVYSAKFGIRNPIGVEGNLVVHDLERETVLDMLRSQFILYPHIDIEFSYMKQELNVFKAEVWAVLLEAARGGEEWAVGVFQAVVQEAHRRHLVFPPPEITALTRQIQNNLKKMTTYLVSEKLEPVFQMLKQLLNTPTALYLKKVTYTTWLFMQWTNRQLPSDLYHPYQEHIVWTKEIQSYNFLMRKVGKQIVEIIQTGGESLHTTIQHLFRQLESTAIFQALKEDVVAFIVSHSDPEQREALEEVLARVMATLQDDLAPLKNNPTLLWMTLLTLRNINAAVGKITVTPLTAMRDMLWAYNSYNTIPSNNLMWLYDYSLLPSQWSELLPPWNRTAMVVGGTEILTFDGAKLRMPLSICEVILASFAGNKVTLSHPIEGSRAQVTVATPRVTVVVRPDFHVLLNGRDIGHEDVTEGEVTIMISYLQITIIVPFMKVRVLDQQRVVSVEALGWTFGHLAGMLGTFDGETSNDRLMSTGTRAPDLWRLVKSWQEDQHCPTPPVGPITPSIRETERIAHCYPLLGTWQRCNALVRPEPFIHMCYVTPSPCDAAEAYRSLCAIKGVEPLIPRGC